MRFVIHTNQSYNQADFVISSTSDYDINDDGNSNDATVASLSFS